MYTFVSPRKNLWVFLLFFIGLPICSTEKTVIYVLKTRDHVWKLFFEPQRELLKKAYYTEVRKRNKEVVKAVKEKIKKNISLQSLFQKRRDILKLLQTHFVQDPVKGTIADDPVLVMFIKGLIKQINRLVLSQVDKIEKEVNQHITKITIRKFRLKKQHLKALKQWIIKHQTKVDRQLDELQHEITQHQQKINSYHNAIDKQLDELFMEVSKNNHDTEQQNNKKQINKPLRDIKDHISKTDKHSKYQLSQMQSFIEKTNKRSNDRNKVVQSHLELTSQTVNEDQEKKYTTSLVNTLINAIMIVRLYGKE